jgi:hypothetical protein
MEHVARTGLVEHDVKFLLRNNREADYIRDLEIDGIILKFVL